MRPAIAQLLFVALPYAAVVLFVVGTVERFRRHPSSVTSHSSQFFESRRHFWGFMPFHFGILAVFVLHAVWFLAPGLMQRWNAMPMRLYAIEVLALACGLAALVGYVAIGLRRSADRRLLRVTSGWDWCVYALLLTQIALGVAVAVLHPWGAGWFPVVAAPYLWSLVRFSPDIAAISVMPPLVLAHIVTAWLLFAIFPFSRLVHILSVPNPYLWRAPQVVRWRRGSRLAAGDRT